MCNACGFVCCGWDGFGGCGCDGCDEPECWTPDDEGDFGDGDDFEFARCCPAPARLPFTCEEVPPPCAN